MRIDDPIADAMNWRNYCKLQWQALHIAASLALPYAEIIGSHGDLCKAFGLSYVALDGCRPGRIGEACARRERWLGGTI